MHVCVECVHVQVAGDEEAREHPPPGTGPGWLPRTPWRDWDVLAVGGWGWTSGSWQLELLAAAGPVSFVLSVGDPLE